MSSVSIIIPVYNIEQYLPECLDSILAQDYSNYEVILVDDGSTDKSGIICDEYVKKDSRFRVFHKDNGGVSSARNKGLDEVKGDWVFFLDGDDYIVPNALSLAFEISDDTQCEIVDFNYSSFDEHSIRTKFVNPYNKIENSNSCLINSLYYNRSYIYPKIIKTNVIDNIRFDSNIRVGEDICFMINIYLNRSFNICHSKETVYMYRLRPGSAMHNTNTIARMRMLDDYMDNIIAARGLETQLAFFKALNKYNEYLFSGDDLSSEDYSKYISVLKYKDIIKEPLSFKAKVLFFFSKISPFFWNRFLSMMR